MTLSPSWLSQVWILHLLQAFKFRLPHATIWPLRPSISLEEIYTHRSSTLLVHMYFVRSCFPPWSPFWCWQFRGKCGICWLRLFPLFWFIETVLKDLQRIFFLILALRLLKGKIIVWHYFYLCWFLHFLFCWCIWWKPQWTKWATLKSRSNWPTHFGIFLSLKMSLQFPELIFYNDQMSENYLCFILTSFALVLRSWN